ncbi:TRAP transporter substrate-binding protein [Bythopirellula polymerisocia]|uniref:TRAP transporter substrate-binding protein n=1 Tax=Bythopirellula polymerisocia TaxID=2528003 RepID=UPI0018D3CACA|nr:TRAP transporter substrate-binding protein [Bythopirellula polymerisocia]
MSKFTSNLILGILSSLLVMTAYASHLQNQRETTSHANGEHVVLRLAHSLDVQHPVHKAMQEMADAVHKRTNGSLEIQIYPNGQLGNESECVEQMLQGALEMVKISAATLENFVPDMAVFGIPYLFRDEVHFWHALDGDVGRELLLAGEPTGIRGLCYYDAGSRNFYTVNRPILVPNDLRNLKIRVMQSRTSMDMIQALGGAPTPIAWGELYTALQQGVVDGAENNLPSYYSSRHFEVCKELSLSEHTRIPDVLLIGSSSWDSLSLRHQKILQEAANLSSQLERRLWQEESAKALEAVERAGAHVNHPERDPFVKLALPMQELLSEGPIGDIVRRIQEVP